MFKTKTIRPKYSVDEVMEQVTERLPALVDNMYLDREWVWLCNVNLSGEHNAESRATLKEIGFRFSPGGHLMPDGETRGSWGHSCEKPMGPRHKKRTTFTALTEESYDLAELGL